MAAVSAMTVTGVLGSVAGQQKAAIQLGISIGGHRERSVADSRTVRCHSPLCTKSAGFPTSPHSFPMSPGFPMSVSGFEELVYIVWQLPQIPSLETSATYVVGSFRSINLLLGGVSGLFVKGQKEGWMIGKVHVDAILGASSSRGMSVKCAAAVHNKPIGSDQMLVYVPPHPLIKHFVSILRNEITPPALFRSAMSELGRLLIYEASRDWLVTISGEVQTPCGVADVEFIDPREPVKVVPILRAGLVLVEQVATVLPATQTYHLGYVRDEETLLPKLYLNKLPETFPENSRVLVTDPMLATGGTIVAAIEELVRRGVNHKLIRVIAAVAAPPALEKLSQKFPGLHVYTGIIDETLNEKGYIVPGLGDAGDRSFGT